MKRYQDFGLGELFNKMKNIGTTTITEVITYYLLHAYCTMYHAQGHYTACFVFLQSYRDKLMMITDEYIGVFEIE